MLQDQKFHGNVLKANKVVKNILAIYNQCDTATNWYYDANKFAAGLAKKHNISITKVCGIIAALSPLKSWDENKRIVKIFLNGGKIKHTKVMSKKAKDIFNGTGEINEICEILHGNKIRSFFLNLNNPALSTEVTIDRHALAVGLGRNILDKESAVSDKQYNFFEECYKIAAAKVKVQPHFMQSAVWEKWRELKTAAKFEDVPF